MPEQALSIFSVKKLHKTGGFIKHRGMYVFNGIYIFKFNMTSWVLLNSIKSVFEGITIMVIIFLPKDRLRVTMYKTALFLCCKEHSTPRVHTFIERVIP